METNGMQSEGIEEPSAADLAELEEIDKAELVSIPADMRSFGDIVVKADRAAQHTTDPHEKKVLENARLVIYFMKRYRGFGLSDEDLAQEGLMGLMKAVERHDAKKGTLSTYAQYWIRQSIRRALSKGSRTIRLPENRIAERLRVKRAATELEQELQRRPTIAEISARTGYDIKRIEDIYSGKGTVSGSLDDPVGQDESSDATRMNLVADTSIAHPDEALMEKDDELIRGKSAVLQKLNALTEVSDHKKRVFKHHFDLEKGISIRRSLEGTSETFSLTRERVRQIINDVSIRIRNPGAQPYLMRKADKAKSIKAIKHIRATPTFVDWKPDARNDQVESVLSFMAFSYELGTDDLKRRSFRHDVAWAQAFGVIIMIEDLKMNPSTVQAFTKSGKIGLIRGLQDNFLKVLKDDEVIQKETAEMRLHFRTVMGLER